MKINNLKSHPYNKIFRDISGTEFKLFKEDIKNKGIQIPIEITEDNIILCGHQRVRALVELYGKDYELKPSDFKVRKDLKTDYEQKMHIISDNIRRRQLNDIEKVMVCKEVEKLEIEEAKNRQLSTLKKGDSIPVREKFPQRDKGKSRDKTGDKVGWTGKTFKNKEMFVDLATEKELAQWYKTGKPPKSLTEKVKIKKQEIARVKQKKADELRKKRIKEEKEKEEKKRKKELEEKIKKEKLEKEEAERLRKEEEKKLREEEEKNIIVKYQSSEKMDELDESIGLIVTSPPYWRIKEYGQGEGKWEYEDYLKSMRKIWKECFRTLKPSSKLCINIGDQYMNAKENGKFEVIPIHADFIKQCKELGFDYQGAIIWQKVSTMNSSGGGTLLGSYPNPKNGILLFDYEFILIFHKPGASEKVPVDIKDSSAMSQKEWQTYFSSHWNFVGEKQKDHPAQFPEELPKRLIKMFSFKEEIVLDPFLGSGTTLKVAKELERKGIGYEINREEFESIINNKIRGE